MFFCLVSVSVILGDSFFLSFLYMDIKLMIFSEICKQMQGKNVRFTTLSLLKLTETYRKVANRISAFSHVVSLF